MGSPLGRVLANLFMGYYETMWLNTFRECEIILYRRYVDDIICLFNCESDADKFFEFLNSQHSNMPQFQLCPSFFINVHIFWIGS